MASIDKNCGYHGDLDENGNCKCYPGWTSIGDFNPVEGSSCYISVLSTEIMIYISLFLGIISQLLFMYHIFKRRRVNKIFDGKMVFMLFYFVQNVASNIYDTVSLVSPRNAIWGNSILMTFVLSIGFFFAYGGCVIFFKLIMNILNNSLTVLSLDSKQRIKLQLLNFNLRVNMMYGILFVCACVPFVWPSIFYLIIF